MFKDFENLIENQSNFWTKYPMDLVRNVKKELKNHIFIPSEAIVAKLQ